MSTATSSTGSSETPCEIYGTPVGGLGRRLDHRLVRTLLAVGGTLEIFCPGLISIGGPDSLASIRIPFVVGSIYETNRR